MAKKITQTITLHVTKDAEKLWSCDNFRRMDANRGRWASKPLPQNAGRPVVLELPELTKAEMIERYGIRVACQGGRFWVMAKKQTDERMQQLRDTKSRPWICEHQIDGEPDEHRG